MVQNRLPRKACDVCYRKRIRCDAQKPRCSHCILYDSECTFRAPSRKARVPARTRQSTHERREVFQARLEHLESSLDRAQHRFDKFEHPGPQRRTISSIPGLSALPTFSGLHLAGFGFSQTRFSASPLELPPRLEVTCAVEKYLETMNSVLPLFHPEKLRRCVQDWFDNRIDHHDCTTWAAINVVMALASRHMATDETTPHKSVTQFLNNAQSVLHEVLMGDPGVMNVQVLIGMIMLYQATLDLKPAAMLMALTLRLVHELGLHTRSDATQHTKSAERLERDRVFWIVYILDNDISLRTRQPPVQRHVDIDIDWPVAMPDDEAGIVTGPDGGVSFNFFLFRVKLARIQAEIYEVMFSTRAKSLNSYERQEGMARLRYILDDWFSEIPPQFLPKLVMQTEEPHARRAFAVLYASHLTCRTWVCKAHIMESGWLQHLREFGRHFTQGGTVVPIPPLPQGWLALVSEARDYMRLFMSIDWKDPAFIWMTACTYISGSICLMANAMFNPGHDNAEDDIHLANICFSFLEGMIDQAPFESLQRTRNACEELLQYTHAASLQSITQCEFRW